MKLIVCVDNKNGMMFNGRRQSRDSEVCRDILAETGTGRLYVSKYSAGIFEKYKDNRIVCGEIPDSIECGEHVVFAEDIDAVLYEEEADMIIVYCWNKTYPADKYFEIKTGEFTLISEVEFKGTSHDKITKKVYVK